MAVCAALQAASTVAEPDVATFESGDKFYDYSELSFGMFLGLAR